MMPEDIHSHGDRLSLVRHELKSLVAARLCGGLGSDDDRRFRELCGEEYSLLTARRQLLDA
jgi:hypothetical protein